MALINERIKSRRQQLGLTLLQVADALGVKEATAQRYESGDIKNIKHDTVLNLSQILHCDPAYLMGWVDSPFADESANDTAPPTDAEQYLLDGFRKLTEQGQDYMIQTLHMALNTYKKAADPSDSYTGNVG